MITVTPGIPGKITVTVAAAVVVAESGSINPLPSLPVAQNISALRILSNINGLYDYANPATVSAWSIAGISLQSINVGGQCIPVVNQAVTDQSWTWVRGSPVFLGPMGTLTQSAPSTGNLVSVARVLDEKTLFIEIQEPIAL